LGPGQDNPFLKPTKHKELSPAWVFKMVEYCRIRDWNGPSGSASPINSEPVLCSLRSNANGFSEVYPQDREKKTTPSVQLTLNRDTRFSLFSEAFFLDEGFSLDHTP
jgi:hypothetical protein